MSSRPADAEARMPALDGLRGLAIILVLAHNLQLMSAPMGWIARFSEYALNLGWVGVQLFFVLSGFLITGILLDTQRVSNYYSSFFVRRSLRIFPLYFVMLVAVLWVFPTLGIASHEAWSVQWPYWLYMSNWTQPGNDHPALLSHS